MAQLKYETLVGTRDAAKILKVTDARVRQLLAEERIVGAQLVSGVWLIPARRRGRELEIAVSEGTRGPAPAAKR
jgi:hypothetical protein